MHRVFRLRNTATLYLVHESSGWLLEEWKWRIEYRSRKGQRTSFRKGKGNKMASSWKGKHLSTGNRLDIINYVLRASPTWTIKQTLYLSRIVIREPAIRPCPHTFQTEFKQTERFSCKQDGIHLSSDIIYINWFPHGPMCTWCSNHIWYFWGWTIFILDSCSKLISNKRITDSGYKPPQGSGGFVIKDLEAKRVSHLE